MPVRRPRSSRRLWVVLIGPLEGDRGGVLRQPGGREGRDLQGFEGDRTKHRGEMGRKQRIEEVASPVILERSARESRLHQRHHATRFQPLSPLGEGMMPIQNSEDQGFDPATTREPVCRVRGDEAGNHGGNLQTPEDAQDQG
jgi:hypothetical protein